MRIATLGALALLSFTALPGTALACKYCAGPEIGGGFDTKPDIGTTDPGDADKPETDKPDPDRPSDDSEKPDTGSTDTPGTDGGGKPGSASTDPTGEPGGDDDAPAPAASGGRGVSLTFITGGGSDRTGDLTVLSRGNTRTIAGILSQASQTCGGSLPRRYRIDCLRVYYLRMAAKLPDRGDYAPIKAALEDAAARLDAIVEANLDTSAAPKRPRVGGKRAAPRMPPLRAIRPEATAAALAEADSIVAETALVILRSGEDPTRRTAHYQEIAAAVDSNLVILRSA